MRAVHLTAANLDLIRQLDGDQDGWIGRDDLHRADATGTWRHEATRSCTPQTLRRLDRLMCRSTGRLPIALGRRRVKNARDWHDAARRLKDAFAATVSLPDVLLATPSARVGHGDDPGNFYCKHTFYTLLKTASQADSPVQANEHGEKLVGFLHVPADAYCRGKQQSPSASERHRDTRRVVAAALHGWLSTLLAEPSDLPIRILLTGFGAFRRIADNPTGDFVSEVANLDAAMTLAFGERLIADDTVSPDLGPTAGAVRRYALAWPDHTDPIPVWLLAACLPVADEALQPDGDTSILSLMATFKPQAILAMGVASNAREGDYRVEHHADDANWREGRHVVQTAPTHSLPANFALARAILHGGRR